MLREPVFDGQSRYAGELTFIVGYHDEIEGSGMGGDQQVIVADGLADAMQRGTDFRIMTVRRFFQSQNLQSGQDGFQLSGEPHRSFFAAPKRSSQATTMLVHTVDSPTAAIRAATIPVGSLTR
jgi:hypothetical protein